MHKSKFLQVILIALALQCILQYKLMNIISIKCYFRANLKMYVTKNIILGDISQVRLKFEIHSPGDFLLSTHFCKNGRGAGRPLNTTTVSLRTVKATQTNDTYLKREFIVH